MFEILRFSNSKTIVTPLELASTVTEYYKTVQQLKLIKTAPRETCWLDTGQPASKQIKPHLFKIGDHNWAFKPEHYSKLVELFSDPYVIDDELVLVKLFRYAIVITADDFFTIATMLTSEAASALCSAEDQALAILKEEIPSQTVMLWHQIEA